MGIKMKNILLVWLHGYCFDHTRDAEFVDKLCEALDCNLYNLDAPHIGERPRGGFMWHSIPQGHKAGLTNPTETREFVAKCLSQLKISSTHIITETEKELARLGLTWDNVVIAGHSTGADMAVRMALQHQPCKCAISLCGADPEYTIQKNIKFKTTPIIWVAGIGDCILPPEYANCWQVYKDAGVKVEYLEAECRVNGHDYPSENIIPKIADIIGNL